jgi:hypothetical protein
LRDVRLTHIGGPTTLIELGGWTLPTDPTFDAPGGHYNFRDRFRRVPIGEPIEL